MGNEKQRSGPPPPPSRLSNRPPPRKEPMPGTWHVRRNGEELEQPLSMQELLLGIAGGTIEDTVEVRGTNSNEWQPISSVQNLREIFERRIEPPPRQEPKTKPHPPPPRPKQARG